MCPRHFGSRPGHAHHEVRFRLILKLMLVLGLAGLLVNFCVGGFFRLMFGGRAHAAVQRNLENYAHFLAADLGAPPDTAKARALAKDLSLEIRYDGPGLSWATSPAALPGPDQEGAGWRRGHHYVGVAQGPGRYLFSARFQPALEGRWEFVALLICLVSAVLSAAFLAMRRMLSPLRELTRAAERIGRGELGHQVPVKGRDELGELARAFNAMSARLKEMIRSREQLLLDVSHELRSPLTRVKVALEMAPEDKSRDSIRDDVGEMEIMISEILEAARLDSPHGKLNLEDLDLAALAEETATGFRGRAPGLRIFAAPGLRARVDRERVKKVFGNVIDNALKYSQDAGRAVEFSLEPGDEGVIVRVRDYGRGIPTEELPRLFEPFYRVDRSRSRDTGGYGLGLSLCKRIMEAHGGRIEINAPAGGGTEVGLLFPRK